MRGPFVQQDYIRFVLLAIVSAEYLVVLFLSFGGFFYHVRKRSHSEAVLRLFAMCGAAILSSGNIFLRSKTHDRDREIDSHRNLSLF